MCHLSSVIIISVSSVSSSNIFTKYSKVARVQEKPEQIRTENNPLCLRNGSSMILQSFLLGSFEQYTWLRDDSESLYRARFLSSIEWQIWYALFACHGSILKGDHQTTIVGGFKHHVPSPWDEPAEHVLHITLQCCAQQLHRGNN